MAESRAAFGRQDYTVSDSGSLETVYKVVCCLKDCLEKEKFRNARSVNKCITKQA